MKPIVVAGVDFSGTSMVAGMLHAAGVDMGRVLDHPPGEGQTIPYLTYEDIDFNLALTDLAQLQI